MLHIWTSSFTTLSRLPLGLDDPLAPGCLHTKPLDPGQVVLYGDILGSRGRRGQDVSIQNHLTPGSSGLYPRILDPLTPPCVPTT